jgi:hypothetical protein
MLLFFARLPQSVHNKQSRAARYYLRMTVFFPLCACGQFLLCTLSLWLMCKLPFALSPRSPFTIGHWQSDFRRMLPRADFWDHSDRLARQPSFWRTTLSCIRVLAHCCLGPSCHQHKRWSHRPPDDADADEQYM